MTEHCAPPLPPRGEGGGRSATARPAINQARHLAAGSGTRPAVAVLKPIVLLTLCCCAYPGFVCADDYLMGLLAPWNTTMVDFSGLTSASAVSIAIENLQRDLNLNESINLKVITMDSGCEGKLAAGNAVNMHIYQNVDVFIGPPCSIACRPVAALASFWNKPLISWIATDPDFLDRNIFSTMARTLAPFNKMGVFLVQVLEQYNWRRVAVISSTFLLWLDAGKAIKKVFAQSNITVAYIAEYDDSPSDMFIDRVLKKITIEARIIILICPTNERRKFMLRAYDLGMTQGEYVFMTMDVTPQEDLTDIREIWMGNDGRDWAARQAFEAVFHVVLAKLRNNAVGNFRKEVARRMRLPPWDKFTPEEFDRDPNFHYGDRYAAFLHDAVYLYAIAINETLRKGEDPKDGLVLARNMKWKRFYGMSGWVILDRNADREPDYWIMDMALNGSFVKIAELINKGDSTSLGITQVFDTRILPPRWPGGKVGWEHAPADTPPCGFLNELCPEEELAGWAIAISVIIPVVGIICGVLLSWFAYRRVKFESGLREQLWRIRWEDIEPLQSAKIKDGSASLGSTNNSDTHKSADAKSNGLSDRIGLKQGASSSHMQSMPSVGTGAGQLFSSVGIFRGTLVSIKDIKKEHIQISRTLLMEFNEMKDIAHENLNIFVGACIDPPNLCLIWTYCNKGSLQDVLENDAIKLDSAFKFSFMTDMAKGLTYIHSSHLTSHGNLKSSNCLVDSRWTLKITDYGLPTYLAGQNREFSEHELFKRKLWTAPELLRENVPNTKGTQKGDVYSFAIICYEILQRSEPYVLDNVTPRDIVNRVRNGESIPYRPALPETSEMGRPLLSLITKCWSEDPEQRPRFASIRQQLRKMTKGDINIIDNVLNMMEKYAYNLEEIVEERTQELVQEKKKTDQLLNRMLPPTVAESLKLGNLVQPENYEQSSIYFSDIVGFTTIASDSNPMQIVDFLNDLYSCFDSIIEKHDVYKVETIGDAYMVVSGVPVRNGTRHSAEIANVALDLLSSVTKFKIRHRPNMQLQLRIGLHTGPVVAGVVGNIMPRYCLFGDTVNMASRMESSGKPLGIHISKQTFIALKDHNIYQMALRGEVNVKGKGFQTTYWLLGRDGFNNPLPKFDRMEKLNKRNSSDEDGTMTDVV